MREIKFRAWDSETKIMIDCANWEVMSLNSPKICDYDVVMQYTGLKDKNGKEIYEGDILSATKAWDNFSVKWDDECTWFAMYDLDGNSWAWGEFGAIEVIGNIYESPELLEE